MAIDYDKYLDLDDEDLKKLVSHAKNILNLRDQEVIKGLQQRSVALLEKALGRNKKKKLSDAVWKEVSFRNLEPNQLDYFLFIYNLPEYKNHDFMGHGALNHTQTAVKSAFLHKELFDFFIKEKDFKRIMKNFVENEAAIASTTPRDVIKEMFSLGMLETSMENLWLGLRERNPHLVKMLMEKLPLEPEQLRKLYMQAWHSHDETILHIIKEKCGDYQAIKLHDLLMAYQGDYNRGAYENYKDFIKLDEKTFLTTLRTHPFDAQDIKYMLKCFNNCPQQSGQFICFAQMIQREYPHYKDDLKSNADILDNGNFKKLFEKTLLNFELQTVLPEKDEKPTGKPKL